LAYLVVAVIAFGLLALIAWALHRLAVVAKAPARETAIEPTARPARVGPRLPA
jgi:hypothetical protein